MTNLAILLPLNSVNQRLESDPTAMPNGRESAVGIRNSEMTPAVVMRPILVLSNSGNQRLPSGPAVIVKTRVAVGRGNSVMTPEIVTRPILWPEFSVNQRLP